MVTPSGVSNYMNPDDMVITDMQGQVLKGAKKPSSEIKMHLEVYRNRPDVCAVCHAHPQKATAFAVARKVCEKVALPEVVFSIGSVALADYATPSTQQLPDSIRDIVKTTDAILLANHGALTAGSDVFDAYYKMETLGTMRASYYTRDCWAVNRADAPAGERTVPRAARCFREKRFRISGGWILRRPGYRCGGGAYRERCRERGRAGKGDHPGGDGAAGDTIGVLRTPEPVVRGGKRAS